MLPPAFASAVNRAGVPGVLQAIWGLAELRTGPNPVHGLCIFCPICGVATSLFAPLPTWALESRFSVSVYAHSKEQGRVYHSRAVTLSIDSVANNSAVRSYHRGS